MEPREVQRSGYPLTIPESLLQSEAMRHAWSPGGASAALPDGYRLSGITRQGSHTRLVGRKVRSYDRHTARQPG
ncbi:hypothetical protein ACFVIM_24820 [Streptomyces sp. NPDC057638]|uniref:hypothetical protein n=1 Tax=Streptomyces sp. NPDC057638 TaxID=3346190 RepID=UPI0036B274A7